MHNYITLLGFYKCISNQSITNHLLCRHTFYESFNHVQTQRIVGNCLGDALPEVSCLSTGIQSLISIFYFIPR
jgi:hypothetical protein